MLVERLNRLRSCLLLSSTHMRTERGVLFNMCNLLGHLTLTSEITLKLMPNDVGNRREISPPHYYHKGSTISHSTTHTLWMRKQF